MLCDMFAQISYISFYSLCITDDIGAPSSSAVGVLVLGEITLLVLDWISMSCHMKTTILLNTNRRSRTFHLHSWFICVVTISTTNFMRSGQLLKRSPLPLKCGIRTPTPEPIQHSVTLPLLIAALWQMFQSRNFVHVLVLLRRLLHWKSFATWA